MSQITELIYTILIQLYQLTGSLGWALIIFTVAIRSVLLPFTLKSMQAQKAIKNLQPELKKLKNKHSDKKELQKAQLELYQRYNVNPLAGCLPQLVQIALLIVLYQVLISFFGQAAVNGVTINPQFLWLNLSLPDSTYVLPVLVALSQLVFSVMVLPGGEVQDIVPNKSKNKAIKQENKKEEDMADMASSMQKQMLFMMPVLTGVFAARLPSGLALYWLAATIFSVGQQLATTGPGGLQTYTKRALLFVNSRLKSSP